MQDSQKTRRNSAAAITGLVLGIIAAATSLIPIVNNLSFVLAIPGIIFAVIGLVACLRGKRDNKIMAIAATVVNVVAIALVLGSQSMYSAAIDQATKDMNVPGSAVSSGSSSSDAGSSDAAGTDEQPYTVTDEALDSSNEYAASITGTLTNNSDQDKSYIQVEYRLYDASGAQIGTALANTNNLKAGGSWKFEALCTQAPSEIASWELAEVSGF